jgi:hypothetical protein
MRATSAPTAGWTRIRSPGSTVLGALLDELVMSGGAAEALRQDLFQHSDDVGIEEGHAARGAVLDRGQGSARA